MVVTKNAKWELFVLSIWVQSTLFSLCPWLLAALSINPRSMKSYVNAQNQMGAQLNKKHKRYLCAMPPLPIPNDSF